MAILGFVLISSPVYAQEKPSIWLDSNPYDARLKCGEPTVHDISGANNNLIDLLTEGIADILVELRPAAQGRVAGKRLQESKAFALPGTKTEVRGLIHWAVKHGYACQYPKTDTELGWREAADICASALLNKGVLQPGWKNLIQRIDNPEKYPLLLDSLQLLNAFAIEAVISPWFWTDVDDRTYRTHLVGHLRPQIVEALTSSTILGAVAWVAYFVNELSEEFGQTASDVVGLPVVSVFARWVGRWVGREALVYVFSQLLSSIVPPGLLDFWLCHVAYQQPQYMSVYLSFHDRLKDEEYEYQSAMEDYRDALPDSSTPDGDTTRKSGSGGDIADGTMEDQSALVNITTERITLSAFAMDTNRQLSMVNASPSPPIASESRNMCYVGPVVWQEVHGEDSRDTSCFSFNRFWLPSNEERGRRRIEAQKIRRDQAVRAGCAPALADALKDPQVTAEDKAAEHVATAHILDEELYAKGILSDQTLRTYDPAEENRNVFTVTTVRWNGTVPKGVVERLAKERTKEQARLIGELNPALAADEVRKISRAEIDKMKVALVVQPNTPILRRIHIATIRYEPGEVDIPCTAERCASTNAAVIQLTPREKGPTLFDVSSMQSVWLDKMKDGACVNPFWYIWSKVDGEWVERPETRKRLAALFPKAKIATSDGGALNFLVGDARGLLARRFLEQLGVNEVDITSDSIQDPLALGADADEYRRTDIWFACQEVVRETKVEVNGKQIMPPQEERK
ncbi:hypothetical protein A3H75_01250 [Candidatus Uhrbacteria bacterium RIFCSPLOWO2_02_FULL_51_9]|uniref:Uncharacterized protein n=1 Tax=Candidatus Uhrbacteria bacterium RIFCSPLOWO2_02_FULL_51_9 TaxID=1802410 RepID=A0A1F7VG11_9BACT|nr:MAG: hypothetical protein A3H75_01250 [Candidatus Uhrbacteria bacterium RIFCSPLOWO2_02_FULL_51_9]